MMLMKRTPEATADRAAQSARWRAINSAMAGISNAIELCSDAGLKDAVDRLLELQRDVLQERERA